MSAYQIGRGGKKALQWRKAVAAMAKKTSNEHNRTFKFPLAISDDLSAILPRAEELYNIIEGTSEGSLATLVFAVHLSGFRLFSAAAETQVYESNIPDQPFLDVARRCFDNFPEAITPNTLLVCLRKPPRGYNKEWDVEHIRRKFEKSFRIDPEKIDSQLLEVLKKSSIKIHKQCKNWRDIEKDPSGALEIFTKEFKSINSSFPNLAKRCKFSKISPEERILSPDLKMEFHDMREEDSKYWVHHCVSVIVRSLASDGNDIEKIKARDIQGRFTTTSHNALSWLFGAGLDWLQSKSSRDICKELNIPLKEVRRVEQIKHFACALPGCDPLWKANGFSRFRTKVGGKLDGWVANYWNRLSDLSAAKDKPVSIIMNPSLVDSKYEPLFRGNNLSSGELKHAIDSVFPSMIQGAIELVDDLRSGSGYESNHFIKIQEAKEYMESLFGEIEILNNRISQGVENKSISTTDAKTLEINIKNKSKLDRINKIGGGVIDIDELTRDTKTKLLELRLSRKNHYEALMEYASQCDGVDPIPKMIENEQKKLIDRGKDAGMAEENACRFILHQFSLLANRCSEQTRKKVINAIVSVPSFPDRDDRGRKNKAHNKFFFNRQGSIYVSPFSNRRHGALALHDAAFKVDWIAKADRLLKELIREFKQGGRSELLKDILVIEGFLYSMRLRCLPDSIPVKKGKIALEMHNKGSIVIPAVIRAQLNQSNGETSASTMQKIFNYYAVSINGLMYRTIREGFIKRVVIFRSGSDSLIYAPKPGSLWNPPGPYYEGTHSMAQALRSEWIVWKEPKACIDVEATFDRLCRQTPGITKVEMAAYLAQAPHDWWLPMEIKGFGQTLKGVKICTSGKGTVRKSKKYEGLVKLRGPSTWKTMLDRILFPETRKREMLKIGDPNLVFDTQCHQSVSFKNGIPDIEVRTGETRVDAAILFVDKSKSDESLDIFNRIVSIDMGERGIGYAVFDLLEWLNTSHPEPLRDPETDELVYGTLSVPSIRSLIRAVRNSRKRQQPKQKANQNYSYLLQQRRENVVGDVCFLIDRLCQKYNGFPVLESNVGNLESGGRQVMLVYNSVSKMYLHGDNDNQNKKRESNWACGKDWEHPWLIKSKYDNKRKEFSKKVDGKYKLYPGASVGAAGTSQTCHKCKRNPIKTMRDMQLSHLDVDKNGHISLDNGSIKLFDGKKPLDGEKDGTWIHRMRKQNLRILDNCPMVKGKYRHAELEKTLRRNMRHANLSLQSPDTTQSRYRCVYTDCDYAGHADENAAINIGVKFLAERVLKQESKNAHGEWKKKSR